MTEISTEPATLHAATIESYVRFWNAEFAGDQRRLAASAFADDVEYHAPVGVMQGTEPLIDFRNELGRQLGAVEFRLRHAPEVLGDRARLRWAVHVGASGRPFAEGADVLVFGDDGRIGSVSAFLDRAPDGFGPQAHHDDSRREGRW